MDLKRRKRLCYHCEEKWNPTHVCKNPKVYLLQLDESVEGEEEHEYGLESMHKCEEVQKSGGEDLEISIHAISGCPSNNAMKLLGNIGFFSIEILLD